MLQPSTSLSRVACHAWELVPLGLCPKVSQVRSPAGEGLGSRTEGGNELEPAREGTADLEVDSVQNGAMCLTASHLQEQLLLFLFLDPGPP